MTSRALQVAQLVAVCIGFAVLALQLGKMWGELRARVDDHGRQLAGIWAELKDRR